MTSVASPSVATVVLLEDDPDDAFFVRRAFEKAYFANPVVAFGTAEQARRYLGASCSVVAPACFILDVNLAGGETGIAFLRWLRQQPLPLGSTPAMMLTGSDSLAEQDEAEMLGSIYFLRKPVSDKAVTAAVESLSLVVTSLPELLTGRAIERQR